MAKVKIKPVLNVLSIDFDFFQDVDAETLFYYPDGHDFGTEFSKTIWAGHYANPYEADRLNSVDINKKFFNAIKTIIVENSECCKTAMVVNSHVNIYDFIMEEYNTHNYRGVNLVNVDMHHDMFNATNELDCGNWVSYIHKAIPDVCISWIANPVSQEAYGLGENLMQYVYLDLETIKKKKFDLVFLCRSDIWSPPHLDKYFDELYHLFALHYNKIYVDKQITKPRDMKELIDQQKELYSNIKSLNLQGSK